MSADPATSSMGLVFSAAFTGPEAVAAYASGVVMILKDKKDDATITALCVALSKLAVSEQLASKMFGLATALLLFQKQSTAMILLASAVRQSRGRLGAGISESHLAYLSTVTGVDFARDAAFAVFALFAKFAQPEDEAFLGDLLAGLKGEPIAAVCSLIVSAEAEGTLRDVNFGANTPNAMILLIRLLSTFKSKRLAKFVLSVAQRTPSPFSGLIIFGTDVGQKLVRELSDPALLAELAFITTEGVTGRIPVAPLLAIEQGSTEPEIQEDDLFSFTQGVFA
jgi:hypothetical protein